MGSGSRHRIYWIAATVGIAAILILFLMVWRTAGPPSLEIEPELDLSLGAALEAPEPMAPAPPEAPERAFSARRIEIVEPSPGLMEDYAARRPKTVLDLQPFREMSTARIENASGEPGEATLVNLNPYVNVWYLLRIEWSGRESVYYHLQNPYPELQSFVLDPSYLHGVTLVSSQAPRNCPLWGDDASELHLARASRTTYAPLCHQQIFLRNPVEGRKTSKEWVTDFLRDHVWKGESITVFVREKFFQDAYLATSELVAAAAQNGAKPRAAGAPRPPRIDPAVASNYLMPADLGIHLENGEDKRMLIGRWYPVRDNAGIFVSTIEPRSVAPEVLDSLKGLLNPLDDIEETALVFMTAFDLEEFDLGYSLGTEHPRVGWSERALPAVVDASLPGPDGIGTVDPLIMNGMVGPEDAKRLAATFTGGFKRSHGAFKRAELAERNSGSHYGFIEQGTILSKLQPGLATVVVYTDGRVDLKTWTEEDDKNLATIRHARQNGVPILETDPTRGTPRPGALVRHWTLGNWSGSQDQRFRTLRAGLCLQESDAGRFLIYGYFSSATPSAMARVFQAYDCTYAMLLDMNALEHTYLAIYRHRDSRFLIQHLIGEMEVLDKSLDGQDLPRFVGFADNRDLFYLSRRNSR